MIPLKSQDKREAENTNPANSRTLLTLTGESARFEGKFEVADSIEIECEVHGELSVGGKFIIGERGVVKADVQTVDAIIRGEFEGNITATGEVEITSTGRITGSIETDSLVISRGGMFNGNVSRRKKDEAARAAAVLPLQVAEDGRFRRQETSPV